MFLYYAVPKIDLSRPCSAGELCLDTKAECRNGTCQCVHNYYQQLSTCGECHQTWILACVLQIV